MPSGNRKRSLHLHPKKTCFSSQTLSMAYMVCICHIDLQEIKSVLLFFFFFLFHLDGDDFCLLSNRLGTDSCWYHRFRLFGCNNIFISNQIRFHLMFRSFICYLISTRWFWLCLYFYLFTSNTPERGKQFIIVLSL